MKFRLGDVARELGLTTACAERPVTGWSVDSRTLEPGDLFFALRGPNHDGHAFVEEVLRRGAAAAVVDHPAAASGPLLAVPDTQAAMETLASRARKQWGGQVVGVTGSAGKTTTKEAIAQLLASEMVVGKTIGNLNNHVGLPLSILRIPDEARAAVLEIGMNHPGEIRRLAAIARPDIGVVTNVGFAHAEFFDSVDGVALAKRELIESLPPDGMAVLNADDPRVAGFREIHRGPVVTFGTSANADVRPSQVDYTAGGIRFRLGRTGFECSLVGRHGLLNVLAGIAVAGIFGIAPERLVEVVRALAPGKMRGEHFTHAGIAILNDCYNSNPEAARAMLDVLRETPARRRIAVLGEMLELGRWSEPLHRDVGRYAAAAGVDVLVGIRGAARQMVDEAVRSGLPAGAAFFFEDAATAGDFLRTLLVEGDAVLFKGSRGTHIEKALERFCAADSHG
jgi:UDP-N-acetylmuramoyl-tripeptide--D-alanyl-D-alanine ligase